MNNHDPWSDLAWTQAAMGYYRILDENEQLAQRISALEHGKVYRPLRHVQQNQKQRDSSWIAAILVIGFALIMILLCVIAPMLIQ